MSWGPMGFEWTFHLMKEPVPRLDSGSFEGKLMLVLIFMEENPSLPHQWYFFPIDRYDYPWIHSSNIQTHDFETLIKGRMMGVLTRGTSQKLLRSGRG